MMLVELPPRDAERKPIDFIRREEACIVENNVLVPPGSVETDVANNDFVTRPGWRRTHTSHPFVACQYLRGKVSWPTLGPCTDGQWIPLVIMK